jgi:multidrug efflux pump subunit AcrA (membrane-fusion protein)
MTEAATHALRRQVTGLAALLDLERLAREADNPTALAFVMVNRTQTVLPCDTAATWSAGPAGPVLEAVAAVSVIDHGGPFAGWLTARIRAQDHLAGVVAEAGAWSEAPPQALWCPLPGLPAGLVLLRQAPWSDGEIRIAERLAATYSHARAALGRSRMLAFGWPAWVRPRRVVAAVTVAVILLAMLPVRQSAVAPATIMPRQPVAVTAPFDGVIAEVVVQPYQAVSAGQDLVRFDSSQARGRLQMARNSERVAAADLLKTRQRAFSDADAGARLGAVAAQLDLHRSEADYAEELLGRTVIKADRAGIVLFDDPQDWTGKPVVVGERIMTLADPAEVMLQVSLPADEAFVLAAGAPVSFFLNTDPLREIAATITHVAYEANIAPEGFLAYRLTARFTDVDAPPRIGLKGTAKVYGETVALARFLLRRPLAALRLMVRL